MSYSFNGNTRRITLSNGTTEFTTNDLYSRWKDWVRAGNANWLPAFETDGGNPIGGGQTTGFFLFLANGWSVIPWNASHTLTVVGNLLRSPNDLSGVPVFQQVSSSVLIVQRVSVVALGYSTGGGTTITPAQVWNHPDRALSSTGNQAIATLVAQVLTADLPSAIRTNLATELLRITEMWRLEGLDPSAPLVVSDTQRIAGTIQQAIAETASTTTIQRQ